MRILPVLAGLALLAPMAACSKDEAAAEVRVAPGKLPEKPDDYALGPVDAPIQIVEYASLTCPHCAVFSVGGKDPEGKEHEAVLPKLKAKYIDTGKVRYILREFPLDAFAASAALAARCVAGTSPERYYAVVDLIFRKQPEWAFSTKDPDEITNRLAGTLRGAGLGRAQFDQCTNDSAGLARLQAVQTEANEQFKVNSTPTFIINGAVYSGELEFERFEAILAPLLPKG